MNTEPMKYRTQEIIMRWMLTPTLIVAVILGQCFSVRADGGISPVRPATIKFIVGVSGSSKALPGVDVTLLTAKGRHLGKTNEFGELSIVTSIIKVSRARAVLFCAEHFFCGAIRVDPDLFGYSEVYIELAPLAVR
jgi:hypothetical protein